MTTPQQDKLTNEIWQRCPVCKSRNITGHQIEIDGLSAWQEVSCDECNATWTEVYHASHREAVEW